MPIAREQIERLRERLLDHREALLGQVESLDEVAASMSAATQASKLPLNQADNAAQAFEQDFAFANRESEEALLRRIEEALRSIRDGTYGRCVGCGQEIAPERLEALPFATRCLRCQEGEERGLGGNHHGDGDFDVLEEEATDNSSSDEQA